MSIPRPVVDAVRFKNERTMECIEDAEARARRVILALAENPPPDAVQAAREAFWVTWNSASNNAEVEAAMDDALAAFLKHVAGGK